MQPSIQALLGQALADLRDNLHGHEYVLLLTWETTGLEEDGADFLAKEADVALK